MCGITGMLFPDGTGGARESVDTVRQDLAAMTNAITHRGPDDSSSWSDAENGLFLGHQRLAIIDLSVEGRQPMLSASGRYVIVYNGEIYNFAEMQQELKQRGAKFRGHSDTEVLLAAIEEWGLEESIRRSVGMFAFAIYDRRNQELVLVRDRLGIKPLYYGIHRGVLLFGSELKALTASAYFSKEINTEVIPQYLRYNYIPEPHTIWRSTYKLEPGHVLRISADRWKGSETEGIEKQEYWSARRVALSGVQQPLQVDAQEAVDLLDAQLSRAVHDRMVADVPLGAFLSGGVDSSTVVALMQERSARPVKTFSIGFSEAQFNEARYAAEVAGYLGSEHTELYVSPGEAQAVIPLLPRMYDEPYSDYSNIPTYLVSALARQHVTVSLSGDGGDELFGGYNRHMLINGLWGRMKRVPLPLRRAAGAGALAGSPELWDTLAGMAGGILPRRYRLVDPGYKLHKIAELSASRNPMELYHNLVSEWKQPMKALVSKDALESSLISDSVWREMDDLSQIIMYLDLISYLPGDILTKVDRASMAVSLESRVPLLDHRVVELAWKLPQQYKIRDGEGKWALREVLYRRVPRTLIDRPKQGFTVPVGIWLRGPLRSWAEDLLEEKRLSEGGVFRPKIIRSLWKQHLSGKRNHDSKLWPVLMFEAWRRGQ